LSVFIAFREVVSGAKLVRCASRRWAQRILPIFPECSGVGR
jgi:hypothetical protein